MKVRFQADADLRHAIVTGVIRRAPGIDFRGAPGAPLEGLADSAVLAYAAEHDRVLVSHDVNTMPKHFREFVGNDRSPGLVLISQRVPIAPAIDDLVLLWELFDADELVNRAYRVPGLARIL
ncbi:MAG TPA: DUF5615 family PIN-like protein [Bryobacteraceae bacterium]|nr:DUF5615 family PIN-like protein [Bryobacteraceae bacterium]